MSQPNLQKPSAASKSAQAADWLKPAGTCFGVLFLLAGMSLFWDGLTGIPGDETHQKFLTGAALLGGAVGFITVAWGLFDPKPPEAAMKPVLFYGIGAVLLVFVGLFILNYGMHQIGGNDHSILIECGWRLYSGQIGYVDFPCTLPVGCILGAKFAFQWFGVYWRALVQIDALFAVLTFAWSLFLLEQLFGRSWTTLLWAMAVQAFSPMMAAYWWYNPVTAVSAVVYMLSATYWLRRPTDKRAMASYGVALLLMATMKPNVAGVLILGISAVLFVSSRHRWKVVWVSLGAFAGFVVLLSINHLSVSGMIAGYAGIAARGASLIPFLLGGGPLEKRMSMLMIGSLLLPAVVALSRGRKAPHPLSSWIPAVVLLVGLFLFISHEENGPIAYMGYDPKKPIGVATLWLTVALALIVGRKNLRSAGPWIPVVGLLAGVYGFITNSEVKLVDLPTVLMAAILMVAELRSPVVADAGPVFSIPVWWNRYLALACVILGAAGLAQGAARDRVKAIGPFFEYDDSRHVLTDGFFKGVHCGDLFDELLKEEKEVMGREPASTVWFGPRMQWGYAAYNKQSPLQQPVGWDGGMAMYDKAKEDFYFNSFLQSRAPLGIMYKNDVSFLSKEEVQRIVQQYNVDQSFPVLTVLHLKQ